MHEELDEDEHVPFMMRHCSLWGGTAGGKIVAMRTDCRYKKRRKENPEEQGGTSQRFASTEIVRFHFWCESVAGRLCAARRVAVRKLVRHSVLGVLNRACLASERERRPRRQDKRRQEQEKDSGGVTTKRGRGAGDSLPKRWRCVCLGGSAVFEPCALSFSRLWPGTSRELGTLTGAFLTGTFGRRGRRSHRPLLRTSNSTK
jgi:hypothetical protein